MFELFDKERVINEYVESEKNESYKSGEFDALVAFIRKGRITIEEAAEQMQIPIASFREMMGTH